MSDQPYSAARTDDSVRHALDTADPAGGPASLDAPDPGTAASQDAGAELEPEKPVLTEVLVITGMSGGGRSTCAHVLEDNGWYVVENMPPQLLPTLADLLARSPDAFTKLAIVVDVRSKAYFSELRSSLETLRTSGIEVRTVFLDASDEVLVRRFEAGRRPHPLQGASRLLDGILQEREILADLKTRVDLVLDTTEHNVHTLAAEVIELFTDAGPPTLRLTLMSFGFKYGLPTDANFVADMRFVPNPHWVPELRPHTGVDAPVSEYVLSRPGVDEFIDQYTRMLEPVFEGYLRENKHYATVAVGCTGGKHRSVAVTEELAARLRRLDRVSVRVHHRDMGRE